MRSKEDCYKSDTLQGIAQEISWVDEKNQPNSFFVCSECFITKQNILEEILPAMKNQYEVSRNYLKANGIKVHTTYRENNGMCVCFDKRGNQMGGTEWYVVNKKRSPDKGVFYGEHNMEMG